MGGGSSGAAHPSTNSAGVAPTNRRNLRKKLGGCRKASLEATSFVVNPCASNAAASRMRCCESHSRGSQPNAARKRRTNVRCVSRKSVRKRRAQYSQRRARSASCSMERNWGGFVPVSTQLVFTSINTFRRGRFYQQIENIFLLIFSGQAGPIFAGVRLARVLGSKSGPDSGVIIPRTRLGRSIDCPAGRAQKVFRPV